MSGQRLSFNERCEKFSTASTAWAGSTAAQLFAVSLPVIWLLSGAFVSLEDSWHLVFEPITAFIPLIMVFLIQRSQNKDLLAVQLKLNEVVAAIQGANNRLIDVEDLSEQDLEVLRSHYKGLADLAKKEMQIGESHSVEEAQHRHRFKQRGGRPD